MSYNATKIFTAIGKAVARYNLGVTYKAAFETNFTAWIALLNDTDGERRLLADAAEQHDTIKDDLDTCKSDIVNLIENFLLDEIRIDLTVAEEDIDVVLDALSDAVGSAGDKVLENTVSASAPAADPDNTGNGTIPAVTPTQQVHDDNYFVVECTSISGGAGAETWSVKCSLGGTLASATTGVAFTDTTYGVTFTVTAGGVAFAVGDKFTFTTTHDGAGKFQTFFVEQFDTALPSAAAAVNILEAWAS